MTPSTTLRVIRRRTSRKRPAQDLTGHLTLSTKDAISGDMLDTASFAPISRPDMTSKNTLRGVRARSGQVQTRASAKWLHGHSPNILWQTVTRSFCELLQPLGAKTRSKEPFGVRRPQWVAQGRLITSNSNNNSSDSIQQKQPLASCRSNAANHLQVVRGYVGDSLQSVVQEELHSDVERRLERAGDRPLVKRGRSAVLIYALHLSPTETTTTTTNTHDVTGHPSGGR